MTLDELLQDIKDKYEPENMEEGYEDLPSLSDQVTEHGEPYDSRIEDR